jgi:hypothetical protein
LTLEGKNREVLPLLLDGALLNETVGEILFLGLKGGREGGREGGRAEESGRKKVRVQEDGGGAKKGREGGGEGGGEGGRGVPVLSTPVWTGCLPD